MMTNTLYMFSEARSFSQRLKWDLKDGVDLTNVVKGTNAATVSKKGFFSRQLS